MGQPKNAPEKSIRAVAYQEPIKKRFISCNAKSTQHFELLSNTTTQSSSACRKHTVVSLGNKVEVYWCCCRITFEIALCSVFFFLLEWGVGGGVVMKVRL